MRLRFASLKYGTLAAAEKDEANTQVANVSFRRYGYGQFLVCTMTLSFVALHNGTYLELLEANVERNVQSVDEAQHKSCSIWSVSIGRPKIKTEESWTSRRTGALTKYKELIR